ncbi:hypothetical protein [Halomonas sp. hl-4]|uniref:hypothetical protein n=1 Tax=Halomonas sp. hl-4 TaxID=1761789 RepID=UPI0012FE3BB4|nr:hypothetical protein [Halomonas sp. hl-4]
MSRTLSSPPYGYRRLACVLGENRKPIQRILQLKNWQVRKRTAGLPAACPESALSDHTTE